MERTVTSRWALSSLWVLAMAQACVVRADAGESEPCLPSQSSCVVRGRPRCVDPASDRQHCGACDSVCSAGDVCIAGRCAATQCSSGERRCEGDAVLVCARDRTRFERASCPRGEHCTEGGQCTANIAAWPSQWNLLASDAPDAQSIAPWSNWGGACGGRGLESLDGEPVFLSTSDRTMHARTVPWPTESAWALQVRLRWQRQATVLVMVGSYAAVGEGVFGWIEQFQLSREEVSVASLGSMPRVLAARATTEQWHVLRFEADPASARARWLLDGAAVSEGPLRPTEAFGPYLVIAGFGECATNVLAIGEVRIEEGAP